MMGAESVDYHRRTVLERADDYPGMAVSYYASRGETPMRWGGSGAEALGLPERSGSMRTGRSTGQAEPATPRTASGWCGPAGWGWSW